MKPSPKTNTNNPYGLTDIEVDTLVLRGTLGSNKLVASAMHRSVHTVGDHLCLSMKKMNVSDIAQAVLLGARAGLFDDEPVRFRGEKSGLR